ncbi:hypothetical protein RIF29_14577 [Crotalaria pallida]|uniref:Uncharacterized protein n=1 Tax=Crotalaria pallida TaxID=3830 RepID=A0AAN9FI11_CROPI
MRSKTRWFTGFCNLHQVSHLATFFIDAGAEISVAESLSDTRVASSPARAKSLSRRVFVIQKKETDRTRSGASRHEGDRGSPTETLLRILLPLNDKVRWTSHNVADSEPQTSPQSEHFTGPFNR